jgi:hypothetical protein
MVSSQSMTGFKDEQEALNTKSTNDGRGVAEVRTWTAAPYLVGCLGGEGSASIREPLQHPRPAPPSANLSSTHGPHQLPQPTPLPNTTDGLCNRLQLSNLTAQPGSSSRVANLGTSRTCSLKETARDSWIRKPRLHTAGFFLQI